MHYLPTLLKALCLTIALGAPTQAFANVSTPSATPSAEAPVEACMTPEQVYDIIMEQVPDAAIVSISPDNLTITFSSPSKPTQLETHFDEKGCFTHLNEVV